MSDLLAIGYSGVRSYQTALTTVSENISNASSTGYTKRTTNISEVGASSALTSYNGMGSAVTSVSRSADDLNSAAVRSASADVARTDTATTFLDKIQDALDGNGLSDQLTSFFDAATEVAADPSASAARSSMLESAASVATAFSSTSQALTDATADLDSTAEAAVSELSSLSQSLAKVNDGLGSAQSGTSGEAALLDQRDQLLEQMSALTDVTVSYDSSGRATVQMGGSDGPTLVSGTTSSTVTYVRNDEGSVSYSVYHAGTTAIASPSGGTLAGISDAAEALAAAQDQLDTLATGFVDGVNAVQAEGEDLNGNTGSAMFAVGDPASDVSLVMTDPSAIAAAAVGGGTRDNSNLANLTALRTSGGYEDTITDMVAANASKISANETVSSAQTTIYDNAVATRDSASGVNIDEEAVDLIKYQQAYQAASRVIQAARDTFQSILDIQ